MTKLEDEIINKIYKYETKNTVLNLSLRVLILFAMLFLCGGLIYIIYKTLYEQETLSVLQLFLEDAEIIREYFGDVVEILYYEIPKTQVAIFIVAVILLIFILLYFLRNFGRIRRKIKSLITYWQK